MDRRAFLTTTGLAVTAIAGCTDLGRGDGGGDGDGGGYGDGGEDQDTRPDQDNDGVPDSQDDYPDDSDYSVLLQQNSTSVDINEDYYQYFSFSPSRSANLSYIAEVQGDISIDAILVDGTNFTYYEDRTEWEYYVRGTDMDTTYADVDMDIGTDREYYLILDNTSRGGAAPPFDLQNNRVTVDLSYELRA